MARGKSRIIIIAQSVLNHHEGVKAMERETDSCLRCGQSLGLVEHVLEADPVPVPGRGDLCPQCYRDLSAEEYRRYFEDQ